MYTIEQRIDYTGGVIQSPKDFIFRICKNVESEQTWFDLFAEFLEQPNVQEVEAISLGWWFTEEEWEEKYDYLEDGVADLPQYLEAIIGAHEKLKNLKFLYFPDGDWEDFLNYSRIDFPEIEIAPLLNAFSKLEFLGAFGVQITDLDSLQSKSLKVIEYSESYSTEGQTYTPTNKSLFLHQLKQSQLPNLEIIKLYVHPYQNFPEAVEALRQENTFPKLRQIICPDPIKTSQDKDFLGVFPQIHNFLPSPEVVIEDYPDYGSVRLDFTGE
jgi:hypothetical protein